MLWASVSSRRNVALFMEGSVINWTAGLSYCHAWYFRRQFSADHRTHSGMDHRSYTLWWGWGIYCHINSQDYLCVFLNQGNQSSHFAATKAGTKAGTSSISLLKYLISCWMFFLGYLVPSEPLLFLTHVNCTCSGLGDSELMPQLGPVFNDWMYVERLCHILGG